MPKTQPGVGHSRLRPDLRALERWATDRDKEIIDAIEREGSHRRAAESLDINERNLNRALKNLRRRAAKYGYDPDHDLVHPVPPGQKLKGVSGMYHAEKGLLVQWVKTREDRDEQARILREEIKADLEDLPRFKPVPIKAGRVREDMMAVLPMGDPHFGMYAWAEECGDDFDLSIAKRDLCAAVDYLVRQTPRCGRCLIANLGDFFHADNMAGITTRSGHVLDMDTRLPKMYATGVAALRQCVDTALSRHDHVELINAVGNHDEVLSFTLSILFENLYENEPRVTVRSEPTSRHYVRFGANLLGVTHGHQTKDPDLPGIMATERPEDWGATKFRLWMRGHHHHDSRKEYNGAIVQQFRTLAARDSYAVQHGFLSGRDMRALLLHRDHGLMQEHVCSVDMVRRCAA